MTCTTHVDVHVAVHGHVIVNVIGSLSATKKKGGHPSPDDRPFEVPLVPGTYCGSTIVMRNS